MSSIINGESQFPTGHSVHTGASAQLLTLPLQRRTSYLLLCKSTGGSEGSPSVRGTGLLQVLVGMLGCLSGLPVLVWVLCRVSAQAQNICSLAVPVMITLPSRVLTVTCLLVKSTVALVLVIRLIEIRFALALGTCATLVSVMMMRLLPVMAVSLTVPSPAFGICALPTPLIVAPGVARYSLKSP